MAVIIPRHPHRYDVILVMITVYTLWRHTKFGVYVYVSIRTLFNRVLVPSTITQYVRDQRGERYFCPCASLTSVWCAAAIGSVDVRAMVRWRPCYVWRPLGPLTPFYYIKCMGQEREEWTFLCPPCGLSLSFLEPPISFQPNQSTD